MEMASKGCIVPVAVSTLLYADYTNSMQVHMFTLGLNAATVHSAYKYDMIPRHPLPAPRSPPVLNTLCTLLHALTTRTQY